MRNITAFLHISLDGFIAGPQGELDWAVNTDEMTDELLLDLKSTVDTVLYGRVTYQDHANYWPNVQAHSSPRVVQRAKLKQRVVPKSP